MKKSFKLLRLIAIGALFCGIWFGVNYRQGQKQLNSALPDDTRSVLEISQKFELLSLYPYRLDEAEVREGIKKVEQLKRKPEFHGWRAMDKAEIKDDVIKQRLIKALYRGVSQTNVKANKCFEPRHGIRAVKDKEVVELVICFECLQFNLYRNGRQIREYSTIGASPRNVFNNALSRAGIEPEK